MNFLKKIPKRNKNLAWRIIDGEAVVIPLKNQPEGKEEIDTLNETATLIWQLIDGKNCVGDIIKKIINEYDIEPGKARSQVKSFLEDLAQKRLIDF